jgi:hypothetical protein
MAIKVKSGEIKVGSEYFARGDVVTGIAPKDEEQLISLGAAEYAPEPEKESASADPATGADPNADADPATGADGKKAK